MSQPPDLLEPGMLPGEESSPRHGFRGDRARQGSRLEAPLGLSIALSREAGARGGTIGRLAGKRLGWQVYDQELLEFMAQDGVARQGLLDSLTPACLTWVEGRLAELRRRHGFAEDNSILGLARLVLALAAQGEVVLIGRGTGCILPRQSTLNVRVVAPLAERVAYFGQWQRLPAAEAAEKVRARDARRAEFLKQHFNRSADDVHQYDLILNTGLLGEEACADLVAAAARLRWGQEGG
jgi:cytidylate kinase